MFVGTTGTICYFVEGVTEQPFDRPNQFQHSTDGPLLMYHADPTTMTTVNAATSKTWVALSIVFSSVAVLPK